MHRYPPGVLTRKIALLASIGVVAVAAVVAVALSRHGAPETAPPRPAAASAAPTGTAPISAVDWKSATVQFPASVNGGYCVQGSMTFRDGVASTDANTVRLLIEQPPVYGDLTGDGKPEAVLFAACTGSEGTSHPDLLIVSQAPDGALRQIDFVDPNAGLLGALSGARVTSVTIASGTLVVVVGGTPPPSATTTYQWNGSALRQTRRTREGIAARPLPVGPDVLVAGCPHGGIVRPVGPPSFTTADRKLSGISWGAMWRPRMALFHFRTEMQLAASDERVWKVLVDPTSWPDWWRWLRRVTVIAPGRADVLGAAYHFEFRTALPYTLTFDSETVRIAPPSLLESRATGELAGTGLWEVAERDGVTMVRYTWIVATTRWWMNLLAPVARPAFSWNHGVLMRDFAAGLARHLGVRLVSVEHRTVKPGSPGFGQLPGQS